MPTELQQAVTQQALSWLSLIGRKLQSDESLTSNQHPRGHSCSTKSKASPQVCRVGGCSRSSLSRIAVLLLKSYLLLLFRSQYIPTTFLTSVSCSQSASRRPNNRVACLILFLFPDPHSPSHSYCSSALRWRARQLARQGLVVGFLRSIRQGAAGDSHFADKYIRFVGAGAEHTQGIVGFTFVVV